MFRRKYCLQLQGRRLSKKTQKAGSELSTFFLVGLHFNPENKESPSETLVGSGTTHHHIAEVSKIVLLIKENFVV
jgi:hypothetical protein